MRRERLARSTIDNVIGRRDDQRLPEPFRLRRFDLVPAPHRHGVTTFGAVERKHERQRRLRVVAAEECLVDLQLLRVLRDRQRRPPATSHIARRRGRRGCAGHGRRRRLRAVAAKVDPTLQVRDTSTVEIAVKREQGLFGLIGFTVGAVMLSVVILSAAGI